MSLLDKVLANQTDSLDETGNIDDLRRSELPCVIWGAGEVAEKVYGILAQNGIHVDGIVVDKGSDGSFHEYRVKSFAEISGEYGLYNLVVGHNRIDLMSEVKARYKSINKVYCFGNSFGWDEGFGIEHVVAHEKEFQEAYELAEDELSQKAYEEYVCSRVYQNPSVIGKRSITEMLYSNELIKAGENDVFLDVGACKGNGLARFANETGGKYKGMIALEPDDDNYSQLVEFVNREYTNVVVKKIGCWKEKTSLHFAHSGTGRSNHIDVSGESEDVILVDSIDNIVKDNKVTIINVFCQTGLEEILQGAEQTFRKQKPSIIMYCGLRKNDCFRLPVLLKKLNPEYKINYRFAGSLSSLFYMIAN